MKSAIQICLTVLSLISLGHVANASAVKAGSIYNGTVSTLQEVSLDSLVKSLPPGSTAIVSEQHTYQPHHENQIRFLEALAANGAPAISVGMEFLNRPFQQFVDEYLAGLLPEPQFLKSVEWGGNPFDQYRRQVLFPRQHGGHTVALNAAKSLTSRISKVGIAGLSPNELALIPQGFAVGNPAYFERFSEVMKDHVPAAALQRYFEAQSVWDDTMAATAIEEIESRPQERLVIIVGDFHAQYGGGLPDRLRIRGARNLLTISQVNVQGLSDSEAESEVLPHSIWGARADAVWAE
jgi:uncharacterized iron-regulated protein